MRKSVIFWFMMVVIPLVVGLVVYLFFKPSAYVSKLITSTLGIRGLSVQVPNDWFWNIVRYYMCDFLWAFSLTAVIALIFYDSRYTVFISISICLLVGIFIELMQLWHFVSGIFDVGDLIAQSIGSIISIIISMMYLRRNEQ